MGRENGERERSRGMKGKTKEKGERKKPRRPGCPLSLLPRTELCLSCQEVLSALGRSLGAFVLILHSVLISKKEQAVLGISFHSP